MPGPPIGVIVEIVGPTPRRARVVETRPGQSRCELGDGRSVWVPWKKLRPAPKGAKLDVVPLDASVQSPASPEEAQAPPGSSGKWIAAGVVLTLASAVLTGPLLTMWGDTSKVVVFALALAAWVGVPTLVFGVLAVFPRNRNVRSAAQIFTAFGVLGVLGGLNQLREEQLTGNTRTLTARIEWQLKELQQQQTAKKVSFRAAEEKRLVTLRWAAANSQGRDLPYFQVLARMQEPVALLARQEATTRAKVESETLPYRVADVKTKDDLKRVSANIDAYADTLSRLVEHYNTVVARYDEEMRKRGVRDIVKDEGRRDVARAATEQGAYFSNLASRVGIHQQVMKLLDSEWGHWSHDNWTTRVEFALDAAQKEYEQLAAKYVSLGGSGAQDLSNTPSAPRRAASSPTDPAADPAKAH